MVPSLAIILNIILVSTYSQEPLTCNHQPIQGNTQRSGGIDRFSFEVTSNITDIWFSTCGSSFWTFLRVYNSTNALIGESANSQDCAFRAILELNQPKLGDYILELTGAWDESAAGQYILQMFCNKFIGWPELNNCNGVASSPLEFCYMVSDDRSSVSYKYFCDGNDMPFEESYPGSTNCTGNNTVIRSLSNFSHTCNVRNCEYASMTVAYGCQNGSNTTDILRARTAFLIDVCVPGNVKRTCSESSLKIELYKDTICSGDPLYSSEYYLGCNGAWNDNSTFVESIICPVAIQNTKQHMYIWIVAGIAAILLVIACLWRKYQNHRVWVERFSMDDMSTLLNK